MGLFGSCRLYFVLHDPKRRFSARYEGTMKDPTKDKERTWACAEFEVETAHEDMACWLMVQQGSTGCEIIPLEGGKAIVRANFESSQLAQEQLTAIRACFEEYGIAPCLATLKISTIEHEDWLAKWKEGFEPFHAGDRILVCPAWRKDELSMEQKAGRIVLLIEPGMAFGTGLHATTRYCLKSLDRIGSCTNILDVGTGSGILAIAAAMLFPQSHILALEIDDQALNNAHHNIEINGVRHQIELLHGDTALAAGKQFGIVLSNLTCEDNVALLPEYETFLPAGGRLICAGILQEKLPVMQMAIEKSAFKIIDEQLDGMWAGLTMER